MNSKRPYHEDEFESGYSKRPKPFDVKGCADTGSNPAPHDVLRSSETHEKYTIAWICALPLELAASRAMLDEEHQSLFIPASDNNQYVLGRIGHQNIVMTCLPRQYGNTNAALVATDLKRSFPSVIVSLMVGIGGGSPSMADLYLGDVVVGTRVMQYDLGKILSAGRFQSTADAKIPSSRLRSAITDLQASHRLQPGVNDGAATSSLRMVRILHDRLQNHPRPTQPDHLFQAAYEHPADSPDCHHCDLGKLQMRGRRDLQEPRIHYGVIASGNSVIKDGKTRDDIARRLSAMCFEMESAGMMDNLECLPIRGICDYSDSHKNKGWQDYAAATAAAYARELVERLPVWRKEHVHDAMHPTSAGASEPASGHNLTRRQELLKVLRFDDLETRKATIKQAHKRTCRWFLQHPAYLDWLNPAMQKHDHGFLWMRGKAGAGKSTMMKFIYQQTKKKLRSPDTSVASFFFNARGMDLEKSISGMYRSLLVQLLEKIPDLQSVLEDTEVIPMTKQDCPGLIVLKELLQNAVMALGNRSFICFIDALDECDELQDIRRTWQVTSSPV
ncbi:hypothetical protein HYQ44_002203 [Verticillium longisporum]|nr:hypothetical protein HYQ44_002203 [Verticillium longisporum]